MKHGLRAWTICAALYNVMSIMFYDTNKISFRWIIILKSKVAKKKCVEWAADSSTKLTAMQISNGTGPSWDHSSALAQWCSGYHVSPERKRPRFNPWLVPLFPWLNSLLTNQFNCKVVNSKCWLWQTWSTRLIAIVMPSIMLFHCTVSS